MLNPQARHVESVELRHPDIQYDYVRGEAFGEGNRLAAIGQWWPMITAMPRMQAELSAQMLVVAAEETDP